jgi:hypothetical protein
MDSAARVVIERVARAALSIQPISPNASSTSRGTTPASASLDQSVLGVGIVHRACQLRDSCVTCFTSERPRGRRFGERCSTRDLVILYNRILASNRVTLSTFAVPHASPFRSPLRASSRRASQHRRLVPFAPSPPMCRRPSIGGGGAHPTAARGREELAPPFPVGMREFAPLPTRNSASPDASNQPSRVTTWMLMWCHVCQSHLKNHRGV